MTFANNLDPDEAPQNVGLHLRSKLFDIQIIYQQKKMGGNNELLENFERNKYLKKLPSMQRIKLVCIQIRWRTTCYQVFFYTVFYSRTDDPVPTKQNFGLSDFKLLMRGFILWRHLGKPGLWRSKQYFLISAVSIYIYSYIVFKLCRKREKVLCWWSYIQYWF